MEQLNEAFLYRETRLVDKSGCIAFQGSKWEAGSAYIGLKVEVCYSDLHPEVLTIYHELFEPRAIRPLRMAHYTRKEVSPPSLYVKSKVQFPVHTSGNIVSFEGHLNWITSIKELLPEVKFISASVMPNDDKIKNADQIWIQANYLSHANFYKVINIARNRKIKTRYFKSTSAKRCAEQLIEDQDK